MGSYRKIEAVVLNARDYGEAHKIVTLLSREMGKIDAVAKGVRKPKSRSRGAVQWLSLSRFELYEGRGLYTIIQGENLQRFTDIQEDLRKLAYASYLVEFLNEILPQGEASERVFFLLVATLHLLNSGNSEAMVSRMFEVKLLKILGYNPELDNCVSCNAPLKENEVLFSVALGGVLCPQCNNEDPSASRVNAGIIALWKKLATTDLKVFTRLKASSSHNNDLQRLVQEYVLYHLEKRLKSLKFLQEVENLYMV